MLRLAALIALSSLVSKWASDTNICFQTRLRECLKGALQGKVTTALDGSLLLRGCWCCPICKCSSPVLCSNLIWKDRTSGYKGSHRNSCERQLTPCSGCIWGVTLGLKWWLSNSNSLVRGQCSVLQGHHGVVGLDWWGHLNTFLIGDRSLIQRRNKLC